MSGVIVPAKKDKYSQLFQIGGAVAGGVSGGPMGAAQGASAGGALGGLANSGGSAGQSPGVQPAQTSAMDRRIQTYQPQEDPAAQLAAAEQALAQTSPELQKQYAPAIRRARLLSEQNGGMA